MRILTTLKIVLVACLLSCTSQPKEECLHDGFLHEFSKADFESEIPPVNMGYLFFAELNNDSIIATDNFYLYQIYKQHYLDKFSNFHMFLCSLYNNEAILNEDFLNEKMLRNNFIFKKGDTFQKKYLSELKGRYFDDLHNLKSDVNLSDEEKFNLLYFFFRNEYYITESDLTGSFSIWKYKNENSL